MHTLIYIINLEYSECGRLWVAVCGDAAVWMPYPGVWLEYQHLWNLFQTLRWHGSQWIYNSVPHRHPLTWVQPRNTIQDDTNHLVMRLIIFKDSLIWYPLQLSGSYLIDYMPVFGSVKLNSESGPVYENVTNLEQCARLDILILKVSFNS